MGKRQHQKDKMYLTYTEWSQFYGGKKTESSENEHIKFKRLPFFHCTITMAPFENPYCDTEGNIFELEAILAFHKKYKINPVTGKPLAVKNLIKLTFYKNAEKERLMMYAYAYNIPSKQRCYRNAKLRPEEKLKAIERIRNGETKASVARSINVPESTLRGWVKNAEKIRFTVDRILFTKRTMTELDSSKDSSGASDEKNKSRSNRPVHQVPWH